MAPGTDRRAMRQDPGPGPGRAEILHEPDKLRDRSSGSRLAGLDHGLEAQDVDEGDELVLEQGGLHVVLRSGRRRRLDAGAAEEIVVGNVIDSLAITDVQEAAQTLRVEVWPVRPQAPGVQNGRIR